ncbi:MAG: cell division protein FtsB [Myxococcota bacterium]
MPAQRTSPNVPNMTPILDEHFKNKARGVLRWLKRVLIGATAAAAILAAVQFVFNADSRAQSDYFRSELDDIRTRNGDLATANLQLRLQIEGIQHDDRYLEQVARQEFGMLKKGEILYKFGE